MYVASLSHLMTISNFLECSNCVTLENVDKASHVSYPQSLELTMVNPYHTVEVMNLRFSCRRNLPDYLLGAFLDGGGPIPPRIA